MCDELGRLRMCPLAGSGGFRVLAEEALNPRVSQDFISVPSSFQTPFFCKWFNEILPIVLSRAYA